jgi:hypothetical protein
MPPDPHARAGGESPQDEEPLDCHECGGPMMLTDTGISHHLLPGSDGIDWDRDLDHVAYHTED